jgi:hypothetical protein
MGKECEPRWLSPAMGSGGPRFTTAQNVRWLTPQPDTSEGKQETDSAMMTERGMSYMGSLLRHRLDACLVPTPKGRLLRSSPPLLGHDLGGAGARLEDRQQVLGREPLLFHATQPS